VRLRLSQSFNLRIADNSAVDRDNRLFAGHAIVVSEPSIGYAERSWRASSVRTRAWVLSRWCAFSQIWIRVKDAMHEAFAAALRAGGRPGVRATRRSG
jgi:hypothetical protein